MEKNSKQEKTNPALPRTANTPDILVCRFAPLTLSSLFSFPLYLSHQRLPQRRELSPQATEGVRKIKLVLTRCTIDTCARKTSSIFFLRSKMLPALFFPSFPYYIVYQLFRPVGRSERGIKKETQCVSPFNFVVSATPADAKQHPVFWEWYSVRKADNNSVQLPNPPACQYHKHNNPPDNAGK